MKKLILIPFLALALTGAICTKGDNSTSDSDLKKKELDLKEKELNMQKRSEGSSNANENTQGNSSAGNSSIYPQASERLLTSDDVSNLTEDAVAHGDRGLEEVAVAAVELAAPSSANADLQAAPIAEVSSDFPKLPFALHSVTHVVLEPPASAKAGVSGLMGTPWPKKITGSSDPNRAV